MLKLPEQNNPLYKLFNIEELNALTPEKVSRLPSFSQARKIATTYFRSHSRAKKVYIIVTRVANGELWLIAFGQKGGINRLWNFGHWIDKFN